VNVEERRVARRHDYIEDADVIVLKLQVMARLAADRYGRLRDGRKQA
jgi:hypothetical protein